MCGRIPGCGKVEFVNAKRGYLYGMHRMQDISTNVHELPVKVGSTLRARRGTASSTTSGAIKSGHSDCAIMYCADFGGQRSGPPHLGDPKITLPGCSPGILTILFILSKQRSGLPSVRLESAQTAYLARAGSSGVGHGGILWLRRDRTGSKSRFLTLSNSYYRLLTARRGVGLPGLVVRPGRGKSHLVKPLFMKSAAKCG
jgi:hypothetical protein